MGPTVAIFGGGVAGLTAAHELAERGFAVTVYDQRTRLGGKARSYGIPGTGTFGRPDLPAEHGFRFFPGFYRHVPDTMSRIPNPRARSRTVLDDLVDAEQMTFARIGLPELTFPARFPSHPIAAIKMFARGLRNELGLPREDLSFFIGRILYLATASEARRFGQIEQMTWNEWVDADNPARSDAYRTYCADGLTRRLVAARGDEISARTAGYTLLQLIYDLMPRGLGADRLLDGPTNDVWIDPWVAHLRTLGVDFRLGTTLHDLVLRTSKDPEPVVEHAVLNGPGGPTVTADHYVVALPGEVVGTIANDPGRTGRALIAAGAAALGTLRYRWMNGIQFYLRRALPMPKGHVAYMDSPWSLTSIGQAPYWRRRTPVPALGNGAVREILSVCISDWDTPGTNGLKARDCTEQQLHDEVLAQLQQHLNDPGGPPVLLPQDVITWSLDDALDRSTGAWTNTDPLLVNAAGTWSARPDAVTKVVNLFLAGDYVRTRTDLATMEAADESGRLAANGIVMRERHIKRLPPPAKVWTWDLHEPREFRWFRHLDQAHYEQDPNLLPWQYKRHARRLRGLAQSKGKLPFSVPEAGVW